MDLQQRFQDQASVVVQQAHKAAQKITQAATNECTARRTKSEADYAKTQRTLARMMKRMNTLARKAEERKLQDAKMLEEILAAAETRAARILTEASQHADRISKPKGIVVCVRGRFDLSALAARMYEERTGNVWCRTVSRNDPVLVQVVSELGEDASVEGSQLSVRWFSEGSRYFLWRDETGSERVLTPKTIEWKHV